jgi:hypothetical protein
MSRDRGTVLPLLVLGFLLAGTLLAASVAGSAALVAHRRLAADCDGAALAGAAALDRTRVGNPGDTGVLALDPAGVARAVTEQLAASAPAVAATTRVGGGAVTVVCRRTVRVPFGAIIARPHGILETATARASTVIRPST